MSVRFPRFVKFLIIGGSAALIEYGSFTLLIFGLGSGWLIFSQTISFLLGFVVSFIGNKLWVFSSKYETKRQLISYALLAFINLLCSNAVLWILVDVLHTNALFAKIGTMAMVVIWNYVIFSKLIFKQTT